MFGNLCLLVLICDEILRRATDNISFMSVVILNNVGE